MFCSFLVALLPLPHDTGGVAYLAHVGGFVAGLVLAFLFRGRTGATSWAPLIFDEASVERAFSFYNLRKRYAPTVMMGISSGTFFVFVSLSPVVFAPGDSSDISYQMLPGTTLLTGTPTLILGALFH